MRRILYLVRQNLKRRRFRTGVMLGSIMLACTIMYIALILSKGIQDTLVVASQRLGADIVVVPTNTVPEAESALIAGNPTSFYMPASTEEQIRSVHGVKETSPQVYLRSLDAPCCISQVALVGYDPKRDITITPWVLKKIGKPLPDNQIIVGAKVISSVVGTPSKAIGQRLIFMGKPFTVATILEPTGLGADFTVFVTMDAAYRMMEDSPLYPVKVKRNQISTVLLKIEEGQDPLTRVKSIESQVPNVTAITANQLTRSVSGELGGLVDLLYSVGMAFCLLAVVLAGTLFTLSARQRARELGLFRAMGATNSLISKLIITEAAFVAGFGALTGIGLGACMIFAAKDAIMASVGNMYMWPENSYFVQAGLACLGTALFTGILGGFYPARKMSILDPYEAIRKGE